MGSFFMAEKTDKTKFDEKPRSKGRPSNASREEKVNRRFEFLRNAKGENERRLSEILGDHADDSESFMSTIADTWDEKEALLICTLKDELSTEGEVHSQVFDPRLSTIVFERAARVMAQNPTGKAYAISKNDIGKNRFMNLLLRYYQKNANFWHSMVVKSRILDLYSLVYGTMFALVPWTVDPKRNYIGPELIPLPIRTCFPQPSATSIGEADWFQVSSMKTIAWLEQQAKLSDKWKNIDKLKQSVLGTSSDGTGDTKPTEMASFVEEEWYGGVPTGGDKAFPSVELRTEYRRDRWVVFAPKYDNMILRDIPNPYDNGELPIVAKYAFPLLDSIIGLGEFERGKTLQYAINSLINLYMDSVKYSLFPPIQIDPNSVIASTIKWGPGERWLVKRPGVDIRQLRLSPLGLNTFQSTYSFLISAVMNQAGTSEVSSPQQTESTLGKTPQALRLMAARESARDEWDRTMMEDTLTQVYKKWIDMIVKKQEKKVALRIFGEEAKEIAKENPDVVEFFDGEYGVAKIGKENIQAQYDFEIETGSIMKKDLEGEGSNVANILALILKNPGIIEAMRAKGKDVDIGELFKRWLIAGGLKDWDRVVVDFNQAEQPSQPSGQPQGQEAIQQLMQAVQGAGGVQPMGSSPVGGIVSPQPMGPQSIGAGMGSQPVAGLPMGSPPGSAPVVAPQPQFEDEGIANTFNAITQAINGIGGPIPPVER